ncbi:MAG TPA: hypothetical protein VLI94_01855 [Solirubrobacterales bacterium]|nr:hypothetical protein [Solirubrobacterales bacterium]
MGIGSAAAAAADEPFPLERLFDFGPDGTEATDFNAIDSVALDQQDDLVYVFDETGTEATLFRFGPEGEPIAFEGSNPDIDGNRLTGLDPMDAGFDSYVNKVAVNSVSGAVYVAQPNSIVAFEPDGDPLEFTAGGGAGTNEIPALGEVKGVDVDSEGNIYVGHIDGSGKVSIFGSTGEPLTSFAVTNPRSVKVGKSGEVFVGESDSEFSQLIKVVKRFTPTSPPPVSAGTTYSESTFASVPEASSFFFSGLDVDRGNGDVYVLESDFSAVWIRRYDAAATLIESFGAPGTPTESAFAGASAHIAVWDEADEIALGEAIKLYLADQALSGPPSKVAAVGRRVIIGPPEIDNTSVHDVTADSAELRASVDPNTAETTYWFEYGLEDCAVSTCTSVPLGGASIGSGEDPVEVSQSIFDLQPGTTYHYRVVATSSLGSTEGPSGTFTTQLLDLSPDLIDSRVWEMVSPLDKGGALLRGTAGGLVQAASDGEALAYVSLGTIEPDPQGNRAPELSAVLARRDPAGWRSRDIALPNDEVIPGGSEAAGEYKFFSLSLSQGIVMPRGGTLLSPQASERTPYLRQNSEPALYTPLLTGKEGFANVPPGTEFGGTDANTFGLVIPIGATPDLSHVVLQSQLSQPLVAGLTIPSENPRSLYLWTGGQLKPVSLLPSDEGGSMAAFPDLGSNLTSIDNAISDDGSRVFWGRLSEVDGGALYMRDTIAEETVRLDVPQSGASGTGGSTPIFQGASADGTVVFFTDTQQLTADASPTGRDLYRCEIPLDGPAAGCASLVNLSAPSAGSGENGEVLGRVSGVGEDGARIYFVAGGVLDNTPNQYGDSPETGEPNLYLWEEGEGVRFIGTLGDEDRGTWGMRGNTTAFGNASRLSATASPGGRYLVFMSQRSLSGYSNFETTSGNPVQEVFRYDAGTDSLDCLSCNPSGAAPEGGPLEGRPLVNAGGLYNGLEAAAVLPGPFKNELGTSPYRARTALENGRVFFNALDSLVPADSNGEWDVYQWEPFGVGSCSSSSGDAATVRSAAGCVSLLSSGTAEEESAFLDASSSGNDVFFLTPARLSVTDVDDELDVYDARVGGTPATLQPQPECQGEACRAATIPPGNLIPGSGTFQGPGNVKPNKGKRCPKGKRKVRSKGKVRCVARKRPPNRRKASQNRGTVR